MQDNNLPTADYKEFDDIEKAVYYVKSKKPLLLLSMTVWQLVRELIYANRKITQNHL